MSPEELLNQRAPMLDPEELFRGVSIRASSDQKTRDQIAQEGMKTPDKLFGERQLAKPGQALASPQELDMLPGQALPDIILEPLPQLSRGISQEDISACLFPESEQSAAKTGPLSEAFEPKSADVLPRNTSHQQAPRTGPLSRQGQNQQQAPRTGPLPRQGQHQQAPRTGSLPPRTPEQNPTDML